MYVAAVDVDDDDDATTATAVTDDVDAHPDHIASITNRVAVIYFGCRRIVDVLRFAF